MGESRTAEVCRLLVVGPTSRVDLGPVPAGAAGAESSRLTGEGGAIGGGYTADGRAGRVLAHEEVDLLARQHRHAAEDRTKLITVVEAALAAGEVPLELGLDRRLQRTQKIEGTPLTQRVVNVKICHRHTSSARHRRTAGSARDRPL
jgi:hypothetical protein